MSGVAVAQGVLIVGAGPTGLALGNALAHYGIPFSIVDKKSGPSRDSKGLTLNLGTQYGLQHIGLMGTVGSRGGRIRRANLFWEGRRFGAINFSNLKLLTASLITQPQSDTELDLLEPLQAKGIHVQWNTRLVDISQFNDGVQATLTNESGEQIRRNFDYAIGCEGKTSVVRDRIGAVYEGCDYFKYFVLGDFTVRTDLPADQLYYYVYPDTFFILIPIGGGLWRVVVKYDGDVPVEPVTAEDVTAVVTERMGTAFRIGRPIWLSRAPFYTRTTDKLRQGRLFIAGDAAHLFSPIGGTGMNTGIQDAINVAWKLALIYQGYADSGILDAYEAERIEVIRQTAATTDASTRAICGALDGTDMIDKLRPVMSNRNNLRTVFPVAFSGLSIRYTTIYAKHNDTAMRGARRAGELCFGRQYLLDLIETHSDPVVRTAIIIVVRLDGPVDRNHYLRLGELAALVTIYPALAPIVVIDGPEDVGNTIRSSLLGLVFGSGTAEMLTAIGIPPGGLLVIAPDGYVVLSDRLVDGVDVEQVLLRVFSLSRSAKKIASAAVTQTIHQAIQL